MEAWKPRATTPPPTTEKIVVVSPGGSDDGIDKEQPPPTKLFNMTKGLRELYCKVGGRSATEDDRRYRAWRKATVPRRALTHPAQGVQNAHYDNKENELICYAGDMLGPGGGEGPSFEIIDRLGAGSFGQVFRCRSTKTGRLVAIKVVKNCASYASQALIESQIARSLNTNHASPHIVHLFGDFRHLNHVCLVFELLSMNLYELLKQNQFRGLPLASVRHFSNQIIAGLCALDGARIVHCDLKPENILISPSDVSCTASHAAPSVVKIIDFGSACVEGRSMHAYVQSRFYRAPEVLLGARYDAAIDIWSCGCVVAELMLGLPIFPGVSAHNQITRIVEMLGPPPDEVLARGADTENFFSISGAASFDEDDLDASPPRKQDDEQKKKKIVQTRYVLKTPEEYSRDTRTSVPRTKKYFAHRTLSEIIAHYPMRKSLGKGSSSSSSSSEDAYEKEREHRRTFALFAAGMLQQAPHRRWTPKQAQAHPFLTGESYVNNPVESWTPPRDQRADERRHLEWGVRVSRASTTTAPTTTSIAHQLSAVFQHVVSVSSKEAKPVPIVTAAPPPEPEKPPPPPALTSIAMSAPAHTTTRTVAAASTTFTILKPILKKPTPITTELPKRPLGGIAAALAATPLSPDGQPRMMPPMSPSSNRPQQQQQPPYYYNQQQQQQRSPQGSNNQHPIAASLQQPRHPQQQLQQQMQIHHHQQMLLQQQQQLYRRSSLETGYQQQQQQSWSGQQPPPGGFFSTRQPRRGGAEEHKSSLRKTASFAYQPGWAEAAEASPNYIAQNTSSSSVAAYSYTAGAPPGYLSSQGQAVDQTDFSFALQRPARAAPDPTPGTGGFTPPNTTVRMAHQHQHHYHPPGGGASSMVFLQQHHQHHHPASYNATGSPQNAGPGRNSRMQLPRPNSLGPYEDSQSTHIPQQPPQYYQQQQSPSADRRNRRNKQRSSKQQGPSPPAT